MWSRFSRIVVAKTSVTCITMNPRNQHRTRKCGERAVWMDSTELIRRNRVDSAGDIPSPVTMASGPATNTVTV